MMSNSILQVRNPTRGTTLVSRGRVANTMWRRMVGLLNQRSLESGDGLLICPCNSIHSMGMRFRFDALYLDKNHVVVRAISDIPPWRILPLIWRAQSVLELPAGVIAATQTQEGDRLVVET